MMTKEVSTKFVYFMTPLGRGSCASVWPYKSYSENVSFKIFFSTNSDKLVILKVMMS